MNWNKNNNDNNPWGSSGNSNNPWGSGGSNNNMDFEESIKKARDRFCLLYTSPSPRDKRQSRMPSSA